MDADAGGCAAEWRLYFQVTDRRELSCRRNPLSARSTDHFDSHVTSHHSTTGAMVHFYKKTHT